MTKKIHIFDAVKLLSKDHVLDGDT